MTQTWSDPEVDADDRSWIDICIDRLVAAPQDGAHSDAQIQAAVSDHLAHDRLLDAHAITVHVEDGVVNVQGKVRSPSDRNLAAMLAHQVSGDAAVRILLTVQPDLPGEARAFRVVRRANDHAHDPLPPFIT